MANLKKAYKTILDDNFPGEMTITFGDQKLVYRKRSWKIEEKGEVVDRGLRYGENPGQEAALYELVGGNLTLGECRFIEPERGLMSRLDEEMLIQFGKHPGKINLTDIDAALNILKHLMASPAAAVMKHNNPSGVALGQSAGDAIERAFMTDRLAAMGGCVAVSRPLDKQGADFLASNYVEVVVAPSYEEGVVDILSQSKNLRIVEIPRIDRLAEQFRIASARWQEAGEHLHGGGLAAAIGAEEAEDLAALDAKTHVIYCSEIAETHGQSLGLDGQVAAALHFARWHGQHPVTGALRLGQELDECIIECSRNGSCL